jgi:hypothetical protein
MPLGSPGMEMGERFTPYDIVQMNKDGSSRVFAPCRQRRGAKIDSLRLFLETRA